MQLDELEFNEIIDESYRCDKCKPSLFRSRDQVINRNNPVQFQYRCRNGKLEIKGYCAEHQHNYNYGWRKIDFDQIAILEVMRS